MAFLTEYFDEFRPHPTKKTISLNPERHRVAKLEGKWMDSKSRADDKAWTDEQINKFIADTMRPLRGQSTYHNSYCAHLSPEFKTRPFVPKPKRKRRTAKPGERVEEKEQVEPVKEKLAFKDTQVMKIARAIYERDMEAPPPEPLPTHLRIQSYQRPCLYKMGTSEYQESMGRLAYETICKSHWPPVVKHHGGRALYGYPPELPRQPLLDGLPFVGERIL